MIDRRWIGGLHPLAGGVLLGLLLGIVLLEAGCNIVAPAYFLIHGPEKVPAVYELQDRPTVVFVDDRRNAIATNADQTRRAIAEGVTTELMKRELVTMTIRPQDALAVVKQHDRHKSVMSMSDIGEAVGADQLLYIRMLEFRESADGTTPTASVGCYVKVIDIVEHVRLFPPPGGEEEGFLVQISVGPINPELYRTRRSLSEVHQRMAYELSVEITKLFYKHDLEEIGGRLDPNR